MKKLKDKKYGIIVLVIICCIVMAITETIIEPTYIIKSGIKVVSFLVVPLAVLKIINEKVFDDFFTLDKKSILKLLALGAGIYALIMGAYFLTRGVFDYSSLVDSLSADQHVTADSFIWIALYISFGNSLLEEFLFRLIAFIILSRHAAKPVAYIFSSVMFAVYHVAMIGKSFPLPLLLLALVGLAVGGCIFNYVDEKNKNIYNSWVIHMFADFAIMTIWYIHI